MRPRILHRRARREGGSALFIAMMVLVLMGFMGVAALDTVSKDGEIAGFQNRSRTALYAAEAGASHARNLVGDPAVVDERSDTPAFPTQGAPRLLGDAGLYDREFDQPKYYGDPTDPTPIQYVKDGAPAPGSNLQPKGQQLVQTLWQIRVTGESPDGSQARLEVMEARVLSKGY